jgi:hypothetical protein
MAVSQGHQSGAPSYRRSMPSTPLLSRCLSPPAEDYSRAFQAMWNQPSVEHSGHTALMLTPRLVQYGVACWTLNWNASSFDLAHISTYWETSEPSLVTLIVALSLIRAMQFSDSCLNAIDCHGRLCNAIMVSISSLERYALPNCSEFPFLRVVVCFSEDDRAYLYCGVISNRGMGIYRISFDTSLYLETHSIESIRELRHVHKSASI